MKKWRDALLQIESELLLTSPGGLAAFVAEVGRALDVWLIDVWSFDRERDAAVYEAFWRREGASAAELAVVGTAVGAMDEINSASR